MRKELYAKKSIYKNKVFFECYNENCKSRVYLMNGECLKCENFTEHGHDDQKELYEELKALNKIKTKCLESGSSLGELNALSGIRESFRSVCNG